MRYRMQPQPSQPGQGVPGQPGQRVQGQQGQGFQGQPGQGVPGQPGQGVQCQPGQGVQGQPGQVQGQPGQCVQGQPGQGVQGQPGQWAQGQLGYGAPGQLGYGASGQPSYIVQGQLGYGVQGQLGYVAPGQLGYGIPQASYRIQPAPVMMGQHGIPAQGVTWMPSAAPMPGCPPGMEYLTQLDQLLIQQEAPFVEILTDWEGKSKFKEMNNAGQQAYYTYENDCKESASDPNPGFYYSISTGAHKDIFGDRSENERGTGLFSCSCDFCQFISAMFDNDKDEESTSYGNDDPAYCCSPLYGIFDSQDNLIAEIHAPCCPCQTVCCSEDVDFLVIDIMDGFEMGKNSTQWSGQQKDTFTDSEDVFVSCETCGQIIVDYIWIPGPEQDGCDENSSDNFFSIIDLLMFEQKQKKQGN